MASYSSSSSARISTQSLMPIASPTRAKAADKLRAASGRRPPILLMQTTSSTGISRPFGVQIRRMPSRTGPLKSTWAGPCWLGRYASSFPTTRTRVPSASLPCTAAREPASQSKTTWCCWIRSSARPGPTRPARSSSLSGSLPAIAYFSSTRAWVSTRWPRTTIG